MSASSRGLLGEISEIEDSLSMKDYHAFIVWFLEQTSYLSRLAILQSMCDGNHDKGIDAVIFNETDRQVTIIQSKFSKDFRGRIPESDIKIHAAIRLYFKNTESLSKIASRSNATTASLLAKAYECVKSKRYELNLTFISTRSAPPGLLDLRQQLGLRANDVIFDRERILSLYRNYLKDFNPPLPPYKLRFTPNDYHIVKRLHGQSAYVLTVPCTEIRDLWLKHGDDLFRKNVRNFLGQNRANNGMRTTLTEYPDGFWYFNNGITMLCDRADLRVEENYVEVENAQIVNGCQTTKSIGKFTGEVQGEVLVRIVESKDNEFAARLTLFQNTFNPVKNRDLKSNDIVQIRLSRELARRGYYFEIKRGQEFSKYKSEHRHSWRQDYPNGEISNEYVAKGLAAIVLGPDVAVAKGSEAFFDPYYNRLFPAKRSVLDCLRVVILAELIRRSYGGEKWHQFDKSFKFKNRALWHVLRYVSDSLNGFEWSRRIVALKETGAAEYPRFQRKFRRITSAYFELLYTAWHRSRLYTGGFESYLTSPAVRKDVKRMFAARLKRLDKKTARLFQDSMSAV